MYHDPSPAISHHTLSVIQRLLHSLSRMPFIDTAELAGVLGEPPVSREWLALLIRRMDAVASVYRLASSLSPGTDGLRSHVEFHRRGRFDVTLTLHDGRSFGVVRQGLALRRRSLYDRLRAIAEYDYTRRPDNVLILVPSVWEERLTTRFCEERNLRDCFVAVGSRDALESQGLRLWCHPTWVFGNSYHSLSCLAFHKTYRMPIEEGSPPW